MHQLISLRKLAISFAMFAVVALTSATTANADVVYLGPLTTQGSGIGAVTTILTLQAQGVGTFERGCVGRAGGADVTCGQDESNGASQTLTRTLAELGVTTGDQLRIVFNIDETASSATSNFVTLQRLEITIWNGNTLLQTFACSNCADANHLTLLQENGIGGSGHAFGLDAAQAAQLQAWIVLHGTGLRVGVTASVGCVGTETADCRGVDNGPETFYGAAAVPTTAPVPEPASMLLLGSGLAGLAAGLRKRFKK